MYKLLIVVFLFLLACEENSSTGTVENSKTFIGSSFSYDINSISGFEKKPFAQKNEDTIVIADYWAMAQQAGFLCKQFKSIPYKVTREKSIVS